MTDALKTILILSEEHTRIEYRRIWGKVDCARIALELLSLEGSLSAEAVEGIAKVDPQILFIDLPKEREKKAFVCLSKCTKNFLSCQSLLQVTRTVLLFCWRLCDPG